jgi:phosphoglycolate phosphatase
LKELLIFDLDGTLINSVPDLTTSVNFMLTKLNRNTFTQDEIYKWVGNGARVLVKRALSGSCEIKNIDKTLFNKAFDIFMNHYQNNLCKKTILYPNVKETLKQLKDKKLAIVTNKPFKFIEPILKNLDINIFDLYIGADSLDEKKPSAKPLVYVCEKLGVNKNKAIMIGDSKNDIIAAKNADIESIGVIWGYNYGEDIKKYNPDYIIDDFKKIIQIIK